MTITRGDLTHTMRSELDRLAAYPDAYAGSCINATMTALERRGLVSLTWYDREMGNPVKGTLRTERWVLTEEGKRIAEQK